MEADPSSAGASPTQSRTKWTDLLTRGTSIATKSLDFVNKQLQDFKQTFDEKSFSANTKSASFTKESGAHALGKRVVLYTIQSPFSPRQCRICFAAGDNEQGAVACDREDEAGYKYAFYLPPEVDIGLLTVAQLKKLIPRGVPRPFHMRIAVQSAVPDFTDVWLDLPEDAHVLAASRGTLHLKILLLPKALHSSPVRQVKVFPAKRRLAASEPSSSRMRPSASLGPPLPGREAILQKRRAEVASRAQQRANEQAALREAERVKEAERDNVSENLQEDMRKWALTEDGSVKDLRLLMSTLSDVLWENSGWQEPKMSELLCMPKLEFRKVYRQAILLCHPDKHQTSSVETQYRAQRIFQVMNEAFKKADS